MITIKASGDFKKTNSYLERIKEVFNIGILDKYGKEGVAVLAAYTPVRTGLTASSWYYKINRSNGKIKIEFFNSNIRNGVPIAIILQYGHGTRNGGYFSGVDYINPAIQPIFDAITNAAWKEVTK